MAKPKSFFSRGRKVQTVDRLILDHKRADLCLQGAGSSDGSEWIVDGTALKNFASCSYMGLERHPDLIAGGQAALSEFGSNFAISRIYLQCPLYYELEDALAEMTDRHILVTPSTTLAHLAALPVIVGDKDLVLVDQFAHASLHMATELISDVPIEILRHSRMDLLEARLQRLDDGVERVWYVCDGVYSMLGDLAPMSELASLLGRYPKLHIYADDAHSISWAGRHGRGAVLSALGEFDRVVVAMSLNKAFGAVGGALAFSSRELRDRVRRCGGPLIFSGPISPGGLGSAVASAKLHLSSQFAELQADLAERVAFARSAIGDTGIELATESDTPILMVHFDSVPAAQAAVRGMRERGFFVCLSTFPAVPVNKPSLRCTISRHNSFADIRELVDGLSEVTTRRPLLSGLTGEARASVEAS